MTSYKLSFVLITDVVRPFIRESVIRFFHFRPRDPQMGLNTKILNHYSLVLVIFDMWVTSTFQLTQCIQNKFAMLNGYQHWFIQVHYIIYLLSILTTAHIDTRSSFHLVGNLRFTLARSCPWNSEWIVFRKDSSQIFLLSKNYQRRKPLWKHLPIKYL